MMVSSKSNSLPFLNIICRFCARSASIAGALTIAVPEQSDAIEGVLDTRSIGNAEIETLRAKDLTPQHPLSVDEAIRDFDFDRALNDEAIEQFEGDEFSL